MKIKHLLFSPQATANRTLSLFLALLIAAGLLLSCGGVYADAEYSFEYRITDEEKKEAEITGFHSTGGIANVVVPDHIDGYKITRIGECAFESCAIGGIELPDTVADIGDGAFKGCEGLGTIKWSKNLRWIGKNAFEDCWCLKTLEFPERLETIGDEAFWNCVNLTTVTVPDSTYEIGGGAFYMCRDLSSISLPSSLTSIGGSAFGYTAYMDDPANWKESRLYIGTNLIKADKKLSGHVEIRGGTTCIASEAFSGCTAIVLFDLPASVVGISENAFGNSAQNAKINIVETHPRYRVVDNCLIDKTNGTLIAAFSGFRLPYNRTLKRIGKGAFSGNNNISRINVPYGVEEIGDYAFENCRNLSQLELPDTLKSIGVIAFENCGLTLLSLPDSVRSVGFMAFYNCLKLDQIIHIPPYAEYGNDCFMMTGYSNNTENWTGDYLYIGTCLIQSYDPEGKYVVKDGTTSIADFVFSAKLVTEITIPESVKVISDYAVGRYQTIIGKAGSTAQDYAKKHGIRFYEDTSDLPFTDVLPEHWFAPYVIYVYKYNLMRGISETTFAPDLRVTRAMFVQVLASLSGDDITGYNGSISFDDVGQDTWYSHAVGWAFKNRVVGGVSAGRFAPNDPITREQMSIMMKQFAENKNYNFNTLASALDEYSDKNEISVWASDSMAWAVTNGFMVGSDGKLMPKSYATRAQTAVIIKNLKEMTQSPMQNRLSLYDIKTIINDAHNKPTTSDNRFSLVMNGITNRSSSPDYSVSENGSTTLEYWFDESGGEKIIILLEQRKIYYLKGDNDPVLIWPYDKDTLDGLS